MLKAVCNQNFITCINNIITNSHQTSPQFLFLTFMSFILIFAVFVSDIFVLAWYLCSSTYECRCCVTHGTYDYVWLSDGGAGCGARGSGGGMWCGGGAR